MKNWIPVNDSRLIELLVECGDAYAEQRYEDVHNLALQILELNDNNPFALAFFALANGQLSKFDDTVFLNVSNDVFEAIEILMKATDCDESSCEMCDLMIRNLGNLAVLYTDEFMKKRSGDDAFYNTKILTVIETLNCVYYDCILLIKDPTKVKSDMYEYIKSVAEFALNITNNDIIAKVIEACDNRLYIKNHGTNNPEINEYWKTHNDEKEELETEAALVLQKLDDLADEINELENNKEKEIQKFKDEINDLKKQKARLSFFRKKEKEVLGKLIEDKQINIYQTEERYAKKLKVIENEKREYDEKAEYYVNIMLNGK